MSLKVWLPLTKDLRNQGLDDVTVTNNGATFNSAGKLGGCYYFNRSAPNYLKITNPLTTATNGVSMAFWVKLPSNGSVNDQLVHIGNGSGWTNNRFTCFVRGGNSTLIFACGDGTNSTQYSCASSALTLNQWTHVVCLYENNKMKIYLNGVLDKEYSTTIVPSFTNVTYVGIGAGPNVTEPATVYLNDVRIYDHALSPLEVKHISQGLVLHYPLSDKYLEDTTNLVTGISAGGQTTVNNNVVTTSGVDKDTYFTINLSENIVVGTQYTFSCDAEIPSGTWRFPLGNQNNTTLDFVLHNGHNVYSFVANDTSWGTKRIFMDDMGGVTNSARSTGLKTKIYNFQLEKKDHETGFAGYGVSRTNTIIYDTSGYGNNGTVSGALTISNDTPKYEVSVYMPTTTIITHNRCLDNTNQEWSCAAWVKPKVAGNYQNLNNFNESNRLYHGTYPILYINSGTNDYYNYGNLALPANQWSHIVFVFKNSTGTKLIYINGENHTNTNGPNKTSTPKGIPDSVIIGNGNYEGGLCDYREYATALSADDVKSLYQNSAYIDNQGNIYGAVYEEV